MRYVQRSRYEHSATQEQSTAHHLLSGQTTRMISAVGLRLLLVEPSLTFGPPLLPSCTCVAFLQFQPGVNWSCMFTHVSPMAAASHMTSVSSTDRPGGMGRP